MSDSSKSAVLVSNLYKSFGRGKWKKAILEDANLHAEQGSIYGLLGASGCGKTTLLSCILGILKADKGEIKTLGGKPGSSNSGVPGKRVGYMPQELALNDQFRCEEILYMFGRINEMKAADIKERIKVLEALLNMELGKKFVSDYSGGQKRRISFAVALLHEPELLCLDEPTVGLDSLLRDTIWKHLITLTTVKKTTIIITTHYMEEARKADRLGLIYSGKVIVEANPIKLLDEMNFTTLEDAFITVCENYVSTKAVIGSSGADENGIEIKTEPNGNKISVCPESTAASTVSLVSYSKSIENGDYSNGVYQGVFKNKCNNKNNNSTTPAFSLNRLFALTKKNYICFFRSYLFIIYFLLFPIVIVVLFALVLGGDLKNVNVAVVNDDVPNDPLCGLLQSCDNKNISCSFLHFFDEFDEVQLNVFGSLDDAKESTKLGNNWGIVHIPENFSVSFAERMLSINNASTSSQSDVSVYLDTTNKPIYELLRVRLSNAMTKTSNEYSSFCNLETKSSDAVIKFEKPVYGPDEPNFAHGLISGMAVISSSLSDMARCNLAVFLFSCCAVFIILPFSAFCTTSSLCSPLRITFMKEIMDYWIVLRYQASVTNVELYLSFLLIYYIIIILQVLLMFLLAFLPFGLPMEGSITLAIIEFILEGTAGFCLGYLISCLVSQDFQAILIIFGIFAINFITAGMMWPIESMPKILSSIFYFGPSPLPSASLKGILLKGWWFTHPMVYPGFIAATAWIIIPVILTLFITRF